MDPNLLVKLYILFAKCKHLWSLFYSKLFLGRNLACFRVFLELARNASKNIASHLTAELLETLVLEY